MDAKKDLLLRMVMEEFEKRQINFAVSNKFNYIDDSFSSVFEAMVEVLRRVECAAIAQGVITSAIEKSKSTDMIHVSGRVGAYVKSFTNQYGEAILIRQPDGREYFAPKSEFSVVKQGALCPR